jgi:hypothetical protein
MGQESLKHLVNKNSNLKYVFELNWQKNWQIPKVESFPIELNFDLFECEREEQEGRITNDMSSVSDTRPKHT